jgi:hypothetical protein
MNTNDIPSPIKKLLAKATEDKRVVKKAIPHSNPVHPMDLKAFKDTGLLLLVNQFLHIFGWAIVLDQEDDGTFSRMYPARTSFRGFDSKNTDIAYRQISRYMRENADVLEKEANEE